MPTKKSTTKKSTRKKTSQTSDHLQMSWLPDGSQLEEFARLHPGQVVMLAILSAFVVSLGTSVVAFALLSGDSVSVTQTINRVITQEPDTDALVSQLASAVSARNTSTSLTDVIKKVQNGVLDIVTIDEAGEATFAGHAQVITRDGLLITTASDADTVNVRYDQEIISAPVVFSNDALALVQLPDYQGAVLDMNKSIELGQDIFALFGDPVAVSTGVIGQMTEIGFTIDIQHRVAGTPIFNMRGALVGITGNSGMVYHADAIAQLRAQSAEPAPASSQNETETVVSE